MRENLFGLGVSEENQIVPARHAKAKTARSEIGREADLIGAGARERIARVESLGNIGDGAGVVHSQREDRNAIERLTRRNHACVAENPAARLEADDVGEPSGNATRACGIGAEREADLSRTKLRPPNPSSIRPVSCARRRDWERLRAGSERPRDPVQADRGSSCR